MKNEIGWDEAGYIEWRDKWRDKFAAAVQAMKNSEQAKGEVEDEHERG